MNTYLKIKKETVDIRKINKKDGITWSIMKHNNLSRTLFYIGMKQGLEFPFVSKRVVIYTTVDIQKVSMGSNQIPSKEDKNETLRNSTYLQSKIIFERDVDNYIVDQKFFK